MIQPLRSAFLAVLGCAFIALAFPLNAPADNHGKVRMYKINKKGQLLKQRWLKDDEVPGCHDTIQARNVHRFAQVGFEYCHIYSKEGCESGSELFVTWRGKRYKNADFDIEQPQSRIARGTEWYLHETENLKVRSWACYYRE